MFIASQVLVWAAVRSHITALASVWWEEPEQVQAQIRAFRRSLFSPIVKKLGYEFPEGEDANTCQLRKLAIGEAAKGDDPR